VSAFRTVASSHQYRGFSSVRIDVLRGPDGEFSREVVEHPDAVAIVALDDALQVALVQQYRHPLGASLLELPAGTLDVPGEDPEAAAHRELAEEIGRAADRLVPLGTVWNSAGWSDERTHLFLATRTTATSRPEGFEAVDEEAAMTIVWRPLRQLVEEALQGALTDAKTIVGVLRADAALRRGSVDAPR
jgi:8-oxo-dGTP pyrophosphatase MutT (NUDIX family)